MKSASPPSDGPGGEDRFDPAFDGTLGWVAGRALGAAVVGTATGVGAGSDIGLAAADAADDPGRGDMCAFTGDGIRTKWGRCIFHGMADTRFTGSRSAFQRDGGQRRRMRVT